MTYNKQWLETILTRTWYRKRPVFWLVPFSLLFKLIVFLRRFAYRIGLCKQVVHPIPIIVVGNITVGGTGKTPCVIALTHYFKKCGFKPGIVSRGYGGELSRTRKVHSVILTDIASDVGDEALLLKQRCQCPVVIARSRNNAVQFILQQSDCDIIISDDGLQHTAMGRTLDIMMVDAARGIGNGYCLPAGPLREPMSRLYKADLLIINQTQATGDLSLMSLSTMPVVTMQLQMQAAYALHQPECTKLMMDFQGKTIHAIAGIGYPMRFFEALRAQGLTIIEHPFSDHHRYQMIDFGGFSDQIILMTEKDAVKCVSLELPNAWVLPVDAVFSDNLYVFLDEKKSLFKAPRRHRDSSL